MHVHVGAHLVALSRHLSALGGMENIALDGDGVKQPVKPTGDTGILLQEVRDFILAQVQFEDAILVYGLRAMKLSQLDPDLRAVMYDMDTERLRAIASRSLDYVSTTLKGTSRFINMLTSPDARARFLNAKATPAFVNRWVHWLHIFEALSTWSDAHPERRPKIPTHFDRTLDEMARFVPLKRSTEIEKFLGAPEHSPVGNVFTAFQTVKYLGTRQKYSRVIEGRATDEAYETLTHRINIAEAAWEQRNQEVPHYDRRHPMGPHTPG